MTDWWCPRGTRADSPDAPLHVHYWGRCLIVKPDQVEAAKREIDRMDERRFGNG